MEAVPSHNCCCNPKNYPETVRAVFAQKFAELIRAELPFNVNRLLKATLSLPMLFLVFIWMKAGGTLSGELFLNLVVGVVFLFHILLALAAYVDFTACVRAYRTLVGRHPLLMHRLSASRAALWRDVDAANDSTMADEKPLEMAE